MTAILVHGVPETSAVWDGVLEALRAEGVGDVAAPDMPGFTGPAREGFPATKEAYLEWLTAEVEAAAEPVDLVGHDWGGILVARLALTRPELIRTWASDAVAILDPEAGWHDLARLWQTPGEGEKFMANLEEMPNEQRTGMLAGAGMPEAYAQRAAAESNPDMNRSILALYRSATEVNREWGADAGAGERPGLAILAPGDPFASHELTRRQAQRLGLEVGELDGLGHWWLVEDPERGARMLRELWARG